MELNLTSVFISCKHAIPFMKRRAQGAIVNVASTSGIRWAGAAQVVHAAAKPGVIQFGRVAVLNATDYEYRAYVPFALKDRLEPGTTNRRQRAGRSEAAARGC